MTINTVVNVAGALAGLISPKDLITQDHCLKLALWILEAGRSGAGLEEFLKSVATAISALDLDTVERQVLEWLVYHLSQIQYLAIYHVTDLFELYKTHNAILLAPTKVVVESSQQAKDKLEKDLAEVTASIKELPPSSIFMNDFQKRRKEVSRQLSRLNKDIKIHKKECQRLQDSLARATGDVVTAVLAVAGSGSGSRSTKVSRTSG